MSAWSRAWVGIPWREHGRDPDGCDCWGLYRLVLARECGIDLPSYVDAYASIGERAEIDAAIRGGAAGDDWVEVRADAVEPYDCVVFRRGRWSAHVGCIVDRDWMLHMAEGQASRLERWRGPAWEHRLVGIWRPRAPSHGCAT